jgi:hypothetical protein
MTTTRLRIRDHLAEQILVSRPSARRLLDPLRKQAQQSRSGGKNAVILDFDGVAGMAPSFFDELLAVVHEAVGVSQPIQFLNQPTQLSRKFETIARGRGLRVVQAGEGRWLFDGNEASKP